MNRTHLFLKIITLVLIASYTNAQKLEIGSEQTSNNYIEIYGIGSSQSRTPFWIQSNQFGTVPKNGSSASIRGGLEKKWNLSKKDTTSWSFSMAAEAVAYKAETTKLLLPQANATLRFKNWELFVGRKKQWVGLADSTMGTGSYAWSTNAMPIPKIHIGTIGYVPIPYSRGWLFFNAFYSDGLFEKSRPVTSELKLHQKAFYLKIGKVNSRVKLYGGFNHQVEWGGKSPYNTANNQMPNGFRNYLNVVSGRAHTKTATIFDSTGRVGNHLGSIDVALELETYGLNIFLYRQSLYDDGSLFWLDNIKDGLNGIRFKKKNHYNNNFEISEVVLEFLYTKSQGGPEADWSNNNPRGKDDYFNNSQVRDGWSYFGRAIGTPFIPPTSDTQWKYPNYADFFTSNNRVSVLHLGLQGNMFQRIDWFTKLSYSSNSGTYNAPFEDVPTQFSGIIGLQTRIKFLGGTDIKGSLAVDNGKLYPNSVGYRIGLRKDFKL